MKRRLGNRPSLPDGAAGLMIPPMTSVVHLIDAAAPGDLLDQLSLLYVAGERVLSLGPPPRRGGFDPPVTAVHRPLGPPALGARRLAERAGSAEVIHAWSPVAARTGRALAERLGGKLFVSLSAAPAANDFDDVLDAVRQGVLRATLLVPTEAAGRVLVGAGTPSEAVRVLRPPAEPPDAPERRRSETRRTLGIGDGERLIAAMGEMTRPAGHKNASWAHAIARQVLGNARLILAGGGPVERRVEFFAHTTGYDDEVFLTGSRFGQADVLAAADMAVFFCERDCGVAALAGAMSAGLPIAASATPDVAECTLDGAAALLARPSDPMAASAAMLRLLEDDELAERLGAAAGRRAGEIFDRRRCRARLDELYAGPAPDRAP